GFGSLKRKIVGLSRGGSSPFTCSMPFANDGRTVDTHRDPHPCEIDREEVTTVFAGQRTAEFQRLSIPAVESKDAIGFRARVPAFDVRTLAAIGFPRTDMATVEIAL